MKLPRYKSVKYFYWRDLLSHPLLKKLLKLFSTPLIALVLISAYNLYPYPIRTVYADPIIPSYARAAKLPPISASTLKLLDSVPLPPPQVAVPGSFANTYAPGNCTWGVASRVHIPNNWGNAISWDSAAASMGYSVGSVPKYGAIAVSHSDSYLGHVALVIAVSGNSYTIWEENGSGGLYSSDERQAGAGEFQSFIYL